MLTLNGFLNALHFIFETRALTKPGAHQPDQISWPVQWCSCLYPLNIWIIGKSTAPSFFPWVLGIQDQILIAKQALFLLSHVLSFCALDLTHTSIQAGHVTRVQRLPVLTGSILDSPALGLLLKGYTLFILHLSHVCGPRTKTYMGTASCILSGEPLQRSALQPGTELLGLKSVRILMYSHSSFWNAGG